MLGKAVADFVLCFALCAHTDSVSGCLMLLLQQQPRVGARHHHASQPVVLASSPTYVIGWCLDCIDSVVFGLH